MDFCKQEPFATNENFLAIPKYGIDSDQIISYLDETQSSKI